MPKHTPARIENLRRAIAQEAARFMAEHGIRDFFFAKRKAAERLNVTDSSLLPSNIEIEGALKEYQRLFGGEKHTDSLYRQRQVALDIMRRLEEFKPRLVGPVLQGTATSHDYVCLQVFADRLENITFKLINARVAYEVGERRIRVNVEKFVNQPLILIKIEEQPIEIMVFSPECIRQSPLSPVDSKPLQRADAAQLEKLINNTKHSAAFVRR
ncbi:MAG: hypothetical protein EXR88_00940 [Gammaproteobacteria bacterium]|nr:hypothetical protein [Gammaproteobacteria bacterium]